MKSAMEGGTSTKKKQKRPICLQFGHRWYTCKNGNPEDIAAMEAERYTFYHLVTFININCFTNPSKLPTAGVHQRKG